MTLWLWICADSGDSAASSTGSRDWCDWLLNWWNPVPHFECSLVRTRPLRKLERPDRNEGESGGCNAAEGKQTHATFLCRKQRLRHIIIDNAICLIICHPFLGNGVSGPRYFAFFFFFADTDNYFCFQPNTTAPPLSGVDVVQYVILIRFDDEFFWLWQFMLMQFSASFW